MKIGFIGCGNMGGALATAVSGIEGVELFVSDYDKKKASRFAEEHGALAVANEEIAEKCDYVFLAVKPNVLSSVLSPLSPILEKNSGSVIVSMAAGVSLEKIEGSLASPHAVIRIMPNTPAAVGEAMITYCVNALVSKTAEEGFLTALSGAGRLDRIDEKLIDAASALAGCGPAFVYMFAEALANGAVQCGLPRDKALVYAAETIRGAASMILKTGKHPGLLKDEVCSPGGSTIEGVAALEEGAFRATAINAVTRAFDKTKALGK